MIWTKSALAAAFRKSAFEQGIRRNHWRRPWESPTKYISKVENGAAAPSLSYVMKFSDITRTDVCYLLRGIKAKTDVTAASMVMEATAPYGKSQTKLSKKGQKICDEMMKKIKEVLEENNI